MATSKATTVEAYLAELPPERREVVAQVRDVVLRNLPAGYRESVSWGMLSYEIPLETYPDTYNGQPLGYVALAAQKNGYSLHLMGTYMDPEQVDALKVGFAASGKKLDMGKSCVRFRKVDDLPLDVIGRAIASTPPQKLVEMAERSRAGRGRR